MNETGTDVWKTTSEPSTREVSDRIQPSRVPGPAVFIRQWEVLRIVGALGIVYFHFGDGLPRRVGYTGLSVFLLLTVALSVIQMHRWVTWRQFAAKRGRRLLVPFVVWSGIYAAVIAVASADGVERSMPLVSWLWAGPVIHLWYLPFAFLALVLAVFPIMRSIPAGGPMSVLTACLVGLISIGPGWVLQATDTELPRGVSEYVVALPAVGFGIGIGLWFRAFRTVSLTAALIGLGLGMTVVGAWLADPDARFLAYFGLALVLVLAAACADVPISPHLERWATLSFPIYLVHPGVAVAIDRVVDLSGRPNLHALITYLVSVALAWMLIRSPLQRYLL